MCLIQQQNLAKAENSRATEISETPSPILSIPLGATDTTHRVTVPRLQPLLLHKRLKSLIGIASTVILRGRRNGCSPTTADSNTEPWRGTEERDGDDILLELAR